MMSRDEEDDSGIMNDVQFQGETHPLLIPNILDKIFDSLPLSHLFKCRRVCKLWNNALCHKISKNGSNTRILKIVDLSSGEGKSIPHVREGPRVKVIDIKEILATIEAGRLEDSMCSKIYFNDSMEFNPSVFETFLGLSRKYIKVFHYDGNKISELKKVLKMCSQNLECLSLWQLPKPSKGSRNGLYEEDGEPKFIFPKLGNITFMSGEDGNPFMSSCVKSRGPYFNPATELPTMYSLSKDFLVDIFEASPKLHSLSCRLYGSTILEALNQTDSYSKLTSLCLKSRVSIPQLHSLISAKMRLKILHLEGLCVTIHAFSVPGNLEPKQSDAELMEFAPLLLEFLKSQASTLEYLKLDLYAEQSDSDGRPDIPTDVLLSHFPRMPNLITFVVGFVDTIANTTDFPFQMSTFAELFPKLRNLENTPVGFRGAPDWDHEYVDIFEGVEDKDFPINYPVSPNASFSLRNIRGVEISPNLAQLFPFITELHLNGNIRILRRIPYCLPRLKHLYHSVNFWNRENEDVLESIRILNGFMTGISPEECQRVEEDARHEIVHLIHLHFVQFARSRPSIFDLNDLETLDFKFSSCHEFMSSRESHGGILDAIGVLVSWGPSRMKHLKKLRFQLEKKMDSENGLSWNTLDSLRQAFGTRNNLETHSKGFHFVWPDDDIPVEKYYNFELNLQHHTSEWNKLKHFSEDPDIWDLGFHEYDIW